MRRLEIRPSEYLSASVARSEIHQSNGAMQIEGLASAFDSVIDGATGATIIVAGAFSKTLKRQSSYPLLYMHDSERPIGRAHPRQSERGLEFSARISDTTLGREVYTLLQDGAIDAVSIGFDAEEDEYKNIEGTKVRVINQIKLWEISIVTFPADSKARIKKARSIDAEIAEMVSSHAIDAELRSMLEDRELSRMTRRYKC